ncbi:Uncharacterised protein [Vibrio owensii]|uniref:hypothetical protein n=1 Tax=Vibrio TaxID=662 RepID=UPI0003AA0D0A|nr:MULTISPECIES: hypothetical protein [Vibrio]ANS87749.1 hypothetical protein VSVS12_04049 [Vibrio scophthalmi]EKP4406941.1 hypothetical protein [Vibrio parahaemolyticus]MBM4805849.1 hypothetical protein [Vibrio parahaemolyticus]MBS9810393.1 hypothetical protein [Vibrio alginolyticus]OEA78269.1 hypothetical protein BBM68_04575 [Vibrio parahaemolyticus]
MSISVQDLHYKTQALEGVMSVLIAGLSVNNPGLVDEIKRITDENIARPGQPEGFVKALKEVRNSIDNINVQR